MRVRAVQIVGLAFVFAGAAVCAWAEAPFPPEYAKQATWAETMRFHRALCLEAQARVPVELGPWHGTQTFRVDSIAEAKFPEEGVDLAAKDHKGNPLWQGRPEYRDWTDNNLPGGENVSTYLYRTLTARGAQSLHVEMRGGEGFEVWLNGEKLFTEAGAMRGVDLALRDGENSLLMKVYRAKAPFTFYFAPYSDLSNVYWPRIEADFPREAGWMGRDCPDNGELAWFVHPDNTDAQLAMVSSALQDGGEAAAPIGQAAGALKDGGVPSDDPAWLDAYLRACAFREDLARLDRVDFAAMRRAIEDLAATFPEQYPNAGDYLSRLTGFERDLGAIREALGRGDAAGREQMDALLALQREALLANPLLNFDRLLLVKRGQDLLGLPQNWQGDCAVPSKGYDNEIGTLAYKDAGASPATLYRPGNGEFVGDVDLHFDGAKMLFSMAGSHGRWQIWEIGADGSGLRQVTPGVEPDVDNYDACYLPDERVVFASTRCIQGIPCVGGADAVANLCLMDATGRNIRQLCFDQDHNWCPTVLNNGRVLYSRWEYSDTPHYFSRILFHMNPDGTTQSEYYGSNSYWPNSIFYARPIPNEPSKVVAIVSGHHGVPRMGELVVMDPARGRFEGDGIVQRIPGYGKPVDPVITDQLVDASWPKFLHPYPLSDKYFLAACKPGPEAQWGIYLVDAFDNMLLLCEQPGYAMFEPIPLRATPRPPVIPDKVKPESQEAQVYLADVYAGEGLKGVPRGTVKKLRVYEVHYCYPKIGGHISIGVEGPWDVHRILGTVPVYEDGSAHFTVPANLPIAVQPLDEKGRAVQVMRSWFTAMPGEALSCVGCHERQNMAAPAIDTQAARRAPSGIAPWHGPARGFSFKREVQPVLDKYCAGCHNGQPGADGRTLPDFSRKERNGVNNFTPSYLALHPFVRRPGPESDYHLQKPMEFHAGTSPLIQMLEKGHHGVKLSEDAWDRLYTWIDLNVPDHGTWKEQTEIPNDYAARRVAMRTQYANRPEDPEAIPVLPQGPVAFVQPEPEPAVEAATVSCEGWPFDAAQAPAAERKTIDLGEGVRMELALIPAGRFVLGSDAGAADERPRSAVEIDKPFWMATVEVTNAQFQRFDATHDNGYVDQHHKDHTTPGYSIQAPDYPAVRISWKQAEAFCRWLSERTGQAFALPTEAQWEWACRAGAATDFHYGDADTDFSAHANLADRSMKLLAVTGVNPQPIENPTPFEDFLPKDARFDDGQKILAPVGKYKPNAWGLFDMHGNAAEWTQSLYRPYPYAAGDGREDVAASGKRVVRGGSWFDRPQTARASYRLAYEAWQPVHNVGFRVVCPADGAGDANKLAAVGR